MHRLVFLLLALFICSNSFAQWTTNVFKLYQKDAELTVGFDNRRTHLYNEFGVIYGLKIGVNFDRRLKNTFVFSSTIFNLGNPITEGENYVTAQLHFASLAEELIFYKKNNLSFSSCFSAGYGFNNKRYLNGLNEVLLKERIRIVPVELGLQSSYVLFTWLELKAGVGWRQLLLGNDDGLSGYFFKLGAGIKFRAVKKTLGL